MKAVWSIFPKFYQHLDVAGLAGLVREVGLDTSNLVVRQGYWVAPENLAADTRAFVRAMSAEGLRVHYAITGYSAEQLQRDPTPLSILADNGITHFRMAYFRGDAARPLVAFDEARRAMARLSDLCARHRIKAVYQIHHGTLVPHSLAAWQIVRDASPQHVGVKLDPGNQCFEGYENWRQAARLLGPYLCALGVKDTAVARDAGHAAEPSKGWSRRWAPLDEGVVNWHEVVGALAACGFDGTLVFNAFYNEEGPQAMTAKLRREVAYLRKVVHEQKILDRPA